MPGPGRQVRGPATGRVKREGGGCLAFDLCGCLGHLWGKAVCACQVPPVQDLAPCRPKQATAFLLLGHGARPHQHVR